MALSTLSCFCLLSVTAVFLIGTLNAVPTTREDEAPTALVSAPQLAESEAVVEHEYIAKLLHCLKLRDDEGNLSLCVPGVFSQSEDFPSSSAVSKIRIYVANATLESEKMAITLNVSKDIFFDHTIDTQQAAVHLRIHKQAVAPHIAEHLKHCDISSGIDLSLSIMNGPSDKSILHTSTIHYNDLLEEMWLDLTSFEDIYNDTTYVGNENVLHMEVNTKNCEFLTLKNLGLEVEEGREPVLVVYEKEQEEEEKLLNYANTNALASQRKRRMTEGSGTVSDPEKCRLISHKVSYDYLRATVPGQFYLNYCSGHCFIPLPENKASPHAQIQAKIRENGHPNLPSPCCVATKYLALSFPIIESKWNYVILTLENISAKDCGCQ